MFTKAQIEKQCLEDFKAYEGKIVKAQIVNINEGIIVLNEDTSPALVRILSGKNPQPRWHDDHCAPLWRVASLDLNPETMWIPGPCRWLNGHVEQNLFALLSDQGFTNEQLEHRCLDDYDKYKGKIVLAKGVHGMLNNDSHDICFARPVRVRIYEMMDKKSIISHHDEWFDTNWDVEILDQQAELLEASSLWIDGISHCTNGKISHSKAWVIDPNQALSREYVEQRCMSEYKKHSGKFLLAKRIFFTLDGEDLDFFLDRPIRVRVVTKQRQSDICQWDDAEPNNLATCSSLWEVEIAEKPFDDKTKWLYKARKIWAAGPSILTNSNGEISKDMDWEIDPDQSRSPTKPSLRNSVSITKICCPYCKNSIKVAISPIKD